MHASMIELPVLNSEPPEEWNRPLTQDDISNCKSGSCSGCGLCCVVYPINDLPGTAGDIDSEPYDKPANTPCVHMKQINRDRYVCLLQPYKNQGRSCLFTCSDFSGTEGRYSDMMEDVAWWISIPKTLEDFKIIQRYHSSGALAHIVSEASSGHGSIFLGGLHHVCAGLESYLSISNQLGYIPHAIMETIGFRRSVQDIGPQLIVEKFRRFQASLSNSALEREFLERYLPEALE